jgi:hypothetical protein
MIVAQSQARQNLWLAIVASPFAKCKIRKVNAAAQPAPL